jgi:hypothetical protein
MLSLDEPAPIEQPKASGANSLGNVISFTYALERHAELQKAEAIRRILSMRDDFKEG